MDVQVSNVYLCRATLIKAIVTVTIDGYLAINNIKVLDLDGRLRIVMPNEVDRQYGPSSSRRKGDTTFHPLSGQIGTVDILA